MRENVHKSDFPSGPISNLDCDCCQCIACAPTLSTQVSWVVHANCSGSPVVHYGTSEASLGLVASARTNLFREGMSTPICVYEAVMGNLVNNTRYYYRPGDANTPLYSFMVPPPTGQLLPGGKPIIYGVLADFGLNNDVSLAQLLQEGEAGAFDVVLHAGESH